MCIQLFFSGDVVLFNNIGINLISNELKELIQSCDVSCCNFEGPISFNEQKAEKKIGPSISQNRDTVMQLKTAGFRLFSIANNHIMDFGNKGLEKTIKILDDEQINHIGAGFTNEEVYKPFYFEKEGKKIGIISVAENGFGSYAHNENGGYAWFGDTEFNDVMNRFIAECDFSIVICHGGAENWSIPLPEYRFLYKSWIDKGVGAIIAHHPHVPQGWEKYKDGFIFYSLGNFAFDKGNGIQNPESISTVLSINDNKIEYKIIKTEFTRNGVIINNKQSFSDYLTKCNTALQSNNYLYQINKKCLEQYTNQYKKYYLAISNIYLGSLKNLLKTFIFLYIYKERFSDLWLFHNIEIETHLWICRRALMLQKNKVENDENFIY